MVIQAKCRLVVPEAEALVRFITSLRGSAQLAVTTLDSQLRALVAGTTTLVTVGASSVSILTGLTPPT